GHSPRHRGSTVLAQDGAQRNEQTVRGQRLRGTAAVRYARAQREEETPIRLRDLSGLDRQARRIEPCEVSTRLARQRPPVSQMLLVSARPGVVGGEQAGEAEALVQSAEIGGPGQNVVERVVRIAT